MQSSDITAQELLPELFEQTRRYLDNFFDCVDIAAIEKVCLRLLHSETLVFVSGVGKSGSIAKKIATTLSSCGTKAHFLPPLEALHGDIGVVSQQDTVILLSTSGETDELLHLCPALRSKGAFLVAVVCRPGSRLGAACDMCVILPVEKELCPFDLAPTTSSVVQLVFGDLLAIALMRIKNISLDQYQQNHPAGRIGRRLTMKVSDIMLKDENLPRVSPHDRLADVLVELTNKKCGCVLVVDAQIHLLGIFTDGNLRRSLQEFGPLLLEKKMEELMNPNPKTTTSSCLAYDAMKFMEAEQTAAIMMLPVVEGKKVVGLIHLHSLVQAGL